MVDGLSAPLGLDGVHRFEVASLVQASSYGQPRQGSES
jgi:hypothetical protein